MHGGIPRSGDQPRRATGTRTPEGRRTVAPYWHRARHGHRCAGNPTAETARTPDPNTTSRGSQDRQATYVVSTRTTQGPVPQGARPVRRTRSSSTSAPLRRRPKAQPRTSDVRPGGSTIRTRLGRQAPRVPYTKPDPRLVRADSSPKGKKNTLRHFFFHSAVPTTSPSRTRTPFGSEQEEDSPYSKRVHEAPENRPRTNDVRAMHQQAVHLPEPLHNSSRTPRTSMVATTADHPPLRTRTRIVQ